MPRGGVDEIAITIVDSDEVSDSAKLIDSVLRRRHRGASDFEVVVPKDLLAGYERARFQFNVVVGTVAAISLLVGGIGIMNIMLATVTERTREIGVRRALGAKRADIIQQFLIEAVVLTSIGGALGVGLGFLVNPVVTLGRYMLQNFSPDLAAALPSTILELEPRIAPWSIIASLAISIGVGVLFGLYPARRAAMMDPIEALRHE
jgi:putative ABC transport system permease protein